MAKAERYEIRLRGLLSDAVLASFEGMSATQRPAETVLRGSLPDQAALHGLIDRAGALGLELISVRQLTTEDENGAASADQPDASA